MKEVSEMFGSKSQVYTALDIADKNREKCTLMTMDHKII